MLLTTGRNMHRLHNHKHHQHAIESDRVALFPLYGNRIMKRFRRPNMIKKYLVGSAHPGLARQAFCLVTEILEGRESRLG